jgi:hypothetical protein
LTVILLLGALTALPCFSTVVQSDGAQSVICTVETRDGYLAIGSISPPSGGVPALFTHILDQNGTVISSDPAAFTGEPVCAAEFQGGAVVVSIDRENGICRVTCLDSQGAELWAAVFNGEFSENAAVSCSSSGILIAGNDALPLQTPRVAKLSLQGEILWNMEYPGIECEVRDVCAYNGQIYVAGTYSAPGWQSDLCLMVMNNDGGNLQFHSVLSGGGRYSVESVEADSRGIFLLVNSMTASSGMIYRIHLVKLNYSMEVMWTGSLSGSSWIRGTDMISLDNTGFAVCGWTNSLPFSESNRSELILCAFNENGELLWSREHGTLSTDYGLGISETSDGGFAVSGCVTEDMYQGWVLKTDSLGNLAEQGIEQPVPSIFSACSGDNPSASGILSIVVNATCAEYLQVTVYDMAGRAVTEETAEVFPGRNVISMNSALPCGVYSVRVEGSQAEDAFRVAVCGDTE